MCAHETPRTSCTSKMTANAESPSMNGTCIDELVALKAQVLQVEASS